MTDEKKEWTVELGPLAQAQVDENPEIAQAIREFSAVLRQAAYGVETGQYRSIDEGIEAITGNRPQPVEEDDPVLDSIQNSLSKSLDNAMYLSSIKVKKTGN